jgi:DNA mismatch repair protein MutS
MTPMLRQYHEIKKQHPGTLLFFRLGDFYELFYDDALIGSREMEITLTARHKEHGAPVPMCGVPYHAAAGYVAKLVRKGYRVAICEQTEDPKAAKKLVKREVIRVITPGTALEAQLLESKQNNYLAAVCGAGDGMGLALLDISTGEFLATEFRGEAALERLREQLELFAPKELLCPRSLRGLLQRPGRDAQPQGAPSPANNLANNLAPPHDSAGPNIAALSDSGSDRDTRWTLTPLDDWLFGFEHADGLLCAQLGVSSLDGFGLAGRVYAVGAAGAAVHYVNETQRAQAAHVGGISFFEVADCLTLDATTVTNLELVEASDGNRRHSLLGVLDETMTGMGARLLRQWLLRPSVKLGEIETRLDAVDEFKASPIKRDQIRRLLESLADLERLAGKITLGRVTPRELVALRLSIETLPNLRQTLSDCRSSLLQTIAENLDELSDLGELIRAAIADEPPAAANEPGMIRDGYHAELDELRHLARSGKSYIAAIEARERGRTGISSLKVKFNNVFGYFIEISNAHKARVPVDYERKQTLVNAERYTTPELKEYEAKVLHAEERIVELEVELFNDVRRRLAAEVRRIQGVARAVALLDVTASLAEVAARNNYVRPRLHEGDEIEIRGGRHPVIETLGERFVPNDLYLNNTTDRLLVITGPNMNGKCVAGETLIFTDRGLTPIAELMPQGAPVGEFTPLSIGVKTLDGAGAASHFYRGGRQLTVRVQTKLGYALEGTPEHRVWVRQPDGGEGWKALGELAAGDYLAIDRQVDLWGDEVDLAFSPPAAARPLRQYRLPSQLTPDLSYLMGLLTGDGTLTRENNFVLTTGDDFIRDEFCRIVREQFGYEVGRPCRKTALLVSSKLIRLFLAHLGLGYEPSYQKRVPRAVRRAPREVVRAFLQGLFDTDGFAGLHYGEVSLSTSSYRLAQEVQLLLLNFGLISSLRRKKTPRRDNFNLFLSGEDAVEFYQKIGFRLPRKQARAALTSAVRRPNKGGVPHLAPLLRQVQARITAAKEKPVALKHVKSVNSIFYTYLPQFRRPSYSKLNELVDYCRENGVACGELERLQRRKYFYDAVVKTEGGEAEVCDLNVPGSHSFLANGLINHNSTYLRQTALISILAQVGSFVPAASAKLALLDRVFTRVGASDNLARGRSTFMVEMTETANILNTATPRSLILLDEVGRGTATFDGLSLAWAIAEYLHDSSHHAAKTLFATHYHELTELAKMRPGVRNYQVAVSESQGEIVFLRKVVAGSASKSYGIEVARLAGLPRSVVERAREILTNLEQNELDLTGKPKFARHLKKPSAKTNQLSLLAAIEEAEPPAASEE